MMDVSALLSALQLADGQFPGGAFAFSWGIESLMADGHLGRRDWLAFLLGQMEARWAGFDRPLIAHAHAASDHEEPLAALDDLAEALSLAAAARSGSRRAGAALLGSHARLGTPGAAAYRHRVASGEVPGHLPVVLGLVLAGAGLDRPSALAVAAHSAAQSLGSAAIRLGLISALNSQSALQALRPASRASSPSPFRNRTRSAALRHSPISP